MCDILKGNDEDHIKLLAAFQKNKVFSARDRGQYSIQKKNLVPGFRIQDQRWHCDANAGSDSNIVTQVPELQSYI